MIQNQIVENANTRAAEEMIKYLLGRPELDMSGLGMIYGPPGLGKSRFGLKFALSHGWVYLRLESTMTAKGFLVRLASLIADRCECKPPRRTASASNQLEWVIDQLARKQINIMIDEIDYAFSQAQLIGAIRDIVDETTCIIVMIGMADAKQRLGMLTEYHYDRCGGFVEFSPLNRKDGRAYLRKVSEMPLSNEQCDRIMQAAGGEKSGNVRRMVKHLRAAEAEATA